MAKQAARLQSNDVVALISDVTEGGGLFFSEIPTGDVDGSNMVFTLLHTPLASVVMSINGLIQRNGIDYSVSGSSVTMDQAPQVGDWVQAVYTY